MLRRIIGDGQKMYTFVVEARLSIPMIDAVQLGTDANSRYKRGRMETTISEILFIETIDNYRCEDVHICKRSKMVDSNDRCSTA